LYAQTWRQALRESLRNYLIPGFQSDEWFPSRPITATTTRAWPLITHRLSIAGEHRKRIRPLLHPRTPVAAPLM
jgi:hypothetical protein